jgi:hypothetical protein
MAELVVLTGARTALYNCCTRRTGVLRFRESAFEHNITEDQIKEVLANRWGMSRWFKIHDDVDGSSQDMVVGFDAEGVLIEVGVTYLLDDEVIFHADNMTAGWANRYNEE